MDVRTLTGDISVADQISAADVKRLREAGFRSIIANRPDGEGADQPLFAEIEKAARGEGLQIRYIPVRTGMVSDTDAAAFRNALDTLPKPTLAFCRSGTRSATLWSLAEAGRRPLSEILARTKDADYDMSGVASLIAFAEATLAEHGQYPPGSAD